MTRKYVRKASKKGFKSNSKIGKLYKLLEKNPQGLKNIDAIKSLKIGPKTMSNLIYRLKHEFNMSIVREGDIHFLKSSNTFQALTPGVQGLQKFVGQTGTQVHLQPQQELSIVTDFKSMGIDFKLILAELEGLSREKKLNYIDQLERSMFFRMSSQAIKSADRISQQLVSLISS